uniref:INV4 n=1 Tax=Arundo donax TaxID=35708 RepID=A0A0A8YD93_ARUDO
MYLSQLSRLILRTCLAPFGIAADKSSPLFLPGNTAKKSGHSHMVEASEEYSG